MNKVKKFILFGASMIFLSSLSFGNGLYFNSYGSKASAMGGAFIGLANDYSAIFWNPAGMTSFNTPRFGLHLADIINSWKYWNKKDCGYYRGPKAAPCNAEVLVDTKSLTYHNNIFGNAGYFTGSAAYYHPLSENLVAGIGIYAPSGFGVDWDKSEFIKIYPALELDLKNSFSMMTISPAIAFKLGDLFSIGGTFNLNYATWMMNSWGGTLYGPAAAGSASSKMWDMGQFSQEMSGWGFGTTVGVLAHPLKWLSVGGTMRLSSKIKFKGTATMQKMNEIPFKTVTGVSTSSDVSVNFTPPAWAGFGIALKPAENLTLTADVQWTNWKKLDTLDYQYHPNWMAAFAEEMTLLADYKINTHSVLPHAYTNRTGQFHWKDTVQYRAGIEYKTGIIAWRAGYCNNPSPVPDQTLNIFFPGINLKSFSLGIGLFWGNLDIDFGFEYLIGDQRVIRHGIDDPLFYDIIQDPAAGVYDPAYAACTPGTYNLSVLVPTISIVYRFGSNK